MKRRLLLRSIGLLTLAGGSLGNANRLWSGPPAPLPGTGSVAPPLAGTGVASDRDALKDLPSSRGAVFLIENGRAGWFIWRGSVPPNIHQNDPLEGVYVAPFANRVGAWLRHIENGVILAEWFGAIADGATDCAPALQAAIEYAADNGLQVKLLSGIYCTSRGLQIKPGAIISGTSMYTSSIKASSAMPAILEAEDSGGAYLLSDFGLNGNSLAQSGLSFRGTRPVTQGSYIGRLRIAACLDKGFASTRPMYALAIDQLLVSGGRFGIWISSNGALNAGALRNCRISNTRGWAIYLENSGASISNAVLQSITIEGNYGGGLYTRKVSLALLGAWFESNGKANIDGESVGRPDIGVDSGDRIATKVALHNLYKSNYGKAQVGRIFLRIFSDQCYVEIFQPTNLSNTHNIDVGAKSNARNIKLNGVKASLLTN